MDLALLGVIGNTLLGKAVTDAYTLAKSSYNVDTSVDYRQLQSQLLEMDVFATLESTGSLLNMLKRQHDLAAYDTGLLLVQQVEETMMTIQNTLQKLVTQTERDRSRWLTLVRPAYNYASFVSTLKSNLKVLETRMAHLLRLIPLLKPDDKKSSPSDLICLEIETGPVRKFLYSLFKLSWKQLTRPKIRANYDLLMKPTDGKSGQTIPKQIWMTVKDKSTIPEKVKQNWKQFSGNIPITIFDDQECESFLLKYFKPRVLQKWQKLKGAHRADLFRYCILYIHGGLYMDVKTKLTRPIDSIFNFNQSDTFYTVLSIVPKTIYQGIIATQPNNVIFLMAISSIVDTPSSISRIDYHVFTKQLYNILQSQTLGELKSGNQTMLNGKNLYLFQEVCDTFNCKTPDQYGRCCSIYKGSDNVIDVRWADYPWK